VHPPHATAFAVARRELPREILPEAEVNLGIVPLAPYSLTGTWEFARTIEPWVKTHDAFLLSSHGAIVAGYDPYDAYYRMETLDQYCRILLLAAQAGGMTPLSAESVQQLLNLKRRLGLRDPRLADQPPLPEKFIPHPGPLCDEPKLGPPGW
jgi:L-fuculose-phosphate aldolase